MPDGITPGERRELRTVVRGQYKVLRAEVKRRADEMRAEIESELLDRYREEDNAVSQAQDQVHEIVREAARQIEALGRELAMGHPDLKVEANRYGQLGLNATNPNKAQLHRAAMSAIPDKIGNANLSLDRGEVELLRALSEGALEGDNAKQFLARIPSVGELVPRARLMELEGGL